MISKSLLVTTGRIVAHNLRTHFGIAMSRLGMTGLNPHPGEGGSMGTEDADAYERQRQREDDEAAVLADLVV